jgi:hypothetical protein
MRNEARLKTSHRAVAPYSAVYKIMAAHSIRLSVASCAVDLGASRSDPSDIIRRNRKTLPASPRAIDHHPGDTGSPRQKSSIISMGA